MTKLVPYVEERLRRPLPHGVPVVPGSTPVLAFGDPTTASVATLGLNPSRVEFLDRAGALLEAEHRRLVDLAQLGIGSLVEADDDQLRMVIAGCDRYFDRNPYWGWFRPLDTLLQHVFQRSYRDASACHLDLSQWATDPVWSGLTPGQRRVLLDEDAPFLAEQLEQENVQVLVLCGRAIIDQMTAVGMVELENVARVFNAAGTVPCDVYRGTAGSTRAYAWSSNLQSQQGIDLHLKQKLAEVLSDLVATKGEGAAVTAGIEEGTEVSGKAELAQLLRTWRNTTHEPTIGDVAEYGGRPYVHVRLDDVHVVLNADTKRAAVERYLQAVDELGPELSWQVVQGRSKLNKVVYQGMETAAGWYAYTTQELEAPRWL